MTQDQLLAAMKALNEQQAEDGAAAVGLAGALTRIEAKLDELLALLRPEAREYVSMHNAAQWPDETCGLIVSMPSTLGGNPSAFGDYQPHDDEPAKLSPVHDPNGGRR